MFCHIPKASIRGLRYFVFRYTPKAFVRRLRYFVFCQTPKAFVRRPRRFFKAKVFCVLLYLNAFVWTLRRLFDG